MLELLSIESLNPAFNELFPAPAESLGGIYA